MICEHIANNHVMYVKVCRRCDRAEFWKQLQYYAHQRALSGNVDDQTALSSLIKYCEHIRDRAEFRQLLLRYGDSYYLFWYIEDVKDRRSFRTAMIERGNAWALVDYCLHVNDRPEMWKAILRIAKKGNSYSILRYLLLVNDRKEFRQFLMKYGSCAELYKYLRKYPNSEEVANELKSRSDSERHKWWRAYRRWCRKPALSHYS